MAEEREAPAIGGIKLEGQGEVLEGDGKGEALPAIEAARPEKVDIGRVVVQKGVLLGAEARALEAQTEAYTMPESVTVADLDADGVYWGAVPKHREDLADDDLLVPPGIDLAAGAYKWDGGGMTFVPLEKKQRKPERQAPTSERALYEVIRAMPSPPAHAVEWADAYEKTIDAGFGPR